MVQPAIQQEAPTNYTDVTGVSRLEDEDSDSEWGTRPLTHTLAIEGQGVNSSHPSTAGVDLLNGSAQVNVVGARIQRNKKRTKIAAVVLVVLAVITLVITVVAVTYNGKDAGHRSNEITTLTSSVNTTRCVTKSSNIVYTCNIEEIDWRRDCTALSHCQPIIKHPAFVYCDPSGLEGLETFDSKQLDDKDFHVTCTKE